MNTTSPNFSTSSPPRKPNLSRQATFLHPAVSHSTCFDPRLALQTQSSAPRLQVANAQGAFVSRSNSLIDLSHDKAISLPTGESGKAPGGEQLKRKDDLDALLLAYDSSLVCDNSGIASPETLMRVWRFKMLRNDKAWGLVEAGEKLKRIGVGVVANGAGSRPMEPVMSMTMSAGRRVLTSSSTSPAPTATMESSGSGGGREIHHTSGLSSSTTFSFRPCARRAVSLSTGEVIIPPATSRHQARNIDDDPLASVVDLTCGEVTVPRCEHNRMRSKNAVGPCYKCRVA